MVAATQPGRMGRMKTTALTCGAMLFLLCFSGYGQRSAPNIDNRVAALIEKTLSEKTEQKALCRYRGPRMSSSFGDY